MKVTIAFLAKRSLGCHSQITKMKFYATYGTKERYRELLELVATGNYDMFEFAPTGMWPRVVIPMEIVDED